MFELEQPKKYYWRKKKEHLAWFEGNRVYVSMLSFANEPTLDILGYADTFTENEARKLLESDFDKFEKVSVDNMYSVFENHLNGGLFIDNDYEPTYCEQCGDEDRFIGNFDNYEQLIEYLADEDGWAGYNEEYLEGIFEEAKERLDR